MLIVRPPSDLSRPATLALVAALCACAGPEARTASATPRTRPVAAAHETFEPATAPDSWAPALARADAAIGDLKQRLGGRLMSALQASGPADAVTVCRDEAPRIAAEIARDRGVAIGRTSDRLRNPRNAPPEWARAAVLASAGRPASEIHAVAVDLGDRVGLLRPIPVAQACTRCHGTPAAVPEDVAARLARDYPSDRAVGYAAGDLRGFFWVEAPK